MKFFAVVFNRELYASKFDFVAQSLNNLMF